MKKAICRLKLKIFSVVSEETLWLFMKASQ